MNFKSQYARRPVDLTPWIAAVALLALVLFALTGLHGCATQSLSQQIATGYKEADNYLTRTETLYDAKIIDKAQAQARLDQVKTAKLGLDAASAALIRCTGTNPPTPSALCSDAASKVTTAQAILNQVAIYLLSQEKK